MDKCFHQNIGQFKLEIYGSGSIGGEKKAEDDIEDIVRMICQMMLFPSQSIVVPMMILKRSDQERIDDCSSFA